VIDTPEVTSLPGRDLELKVSMSDTSLDPEGLRLYQNGVPIREGSDFQRIESQPGQVKVQVRLRRGTNRFYAMASRPDDVDARSQDVELVYDRETAPPRVHVLALGVKNYQRNALRYSDSDARRIADHIHRHGVGETEDLGEKIVLTDNEVTERRVEIAFNELRNAVKDRPEDTVVVFLAGHTEVLAGANGRERFTLLLSPFPFPGDAPVLALNRGVGLGGKLGPKLPPGVDLPFYVIYRNLSRLGALQRLVIIDACQAEAIYEDPGVRQIEQLTLNEKESRRTKTSYLLAARRGELASESEILGHGLLTYVLLRGMQATGLRPPPEPIPGLDESTSADTDGDQVVTTEELRAYADRTLQTLASRLSPPTSRGSSDPANPPQSARGGANTPISPTATPERPHVQGSDAVLGIVTLPGKEPAE
jgi:hypothetical protein